MPFNIVRQDITKMNVDAIVNAANTELQRGGGVCGAIFQAAGADRLQASCNPLAPIQTGQAVITPGFDLPAKYIIHTAGPVYDSQKAEESERLLRSAYTESLRLAAENGCESIAFPLISSGIYGYPKDEALRVATEAIRDFLADREMDVTLTVFDKSSFAVSRDLLGDVASYIDEHYVDAHAISRRSEHEGVLAEAEQRVEFAFETRPEIRSASLADRVGNLDEPFSVMLLRLIDAKGMTDVEVYKRANLDRKLFSKIRSGKGYTPSKRTALALAVGLQLSQEETAELLERAGYALSHAVKFDVIVEYFIINGIYDIFAINEVLFSYDQPLLGGS